MAVEAEQLMYTMTLGKGFIPTNSSVSFLLTSQHQLSVGLEKTMGLVFAILPAWGP